METRLPYLFGLDAIRLAAALIVAAFHLSWLDPATAADAWYGWVGVQIFFVISGLVIANSSEAAGPAQFVRSRFLRLYPTAWTCGILSFLVLAASGAFAIEIVPATMLLLPIGPFAATAYWTLPVELSFYSIVFLLLLMRGVRFLPALAHVLAASSCVYLLLYACHTARIADLPWLEFGYGWKNMLLLRHGVFFSLGIYLWMWSRRELTSRGAVATALCLLMGLVEIGCRSVELVAKSPAQPRLMEMWVPAGAIWAASILLMAGAIHWRSEIAAMPAGILRVLRISGLTTYPLYLMHEVHGGVLRDLFLSLGSGPHMAVLLAVVASGVLAAIVALLVEPPVRRAVSEALARRAASR